MTGRSTTQKSSVARSAALLVGLVSTVSAVNCRTGESPRERAGASVDAPITPSGSSPLAVSKQDAGPPSDESVAYEPEESVQIARGADGVIRVSNSEIHKEFSGPPVPGIDKPPSKPGGSSPGLQAELEELNKQLAAMAPTEKVSATFFLEERPFSWSSFRIAHDDEIARKKLISDRTAELTATQTDFVGWLKSLGATDLHTYFSVNHVSANVEARVVKLALARPGVTGAALPAPAAQVHPADFQTGEQVKDYVRASDLWSIGIRGHAGGKANNRRVRIGVIEVAAGSGKNLPHRNHPVFKRIENPGSRIRLVRDCSSGTCVTTTELPTAEINHGTDVTALAVGSIEEGQDPSYPGAGTSDQRQRSGILTDAYLYYYFTPGTLSPQNPASLQVKAALDVAILDGVDVVNMSFGLGGACNPAVDYSGLNATLRSAAAAGVVMVASAGNNAGSSVCNIEYPAFRPEVLATTVLASEGNSPGYPAYNDTVWSGVSYGGVPTTVYGGGSSTTSAMALSSPGCAKYRPSRTGGVYTYVETQSPFCGTSLAAPVVSGVAGAMRNGLFLAGTPITSGRLMAVNVLMMGDGYQFEWGPGLNTPSGMSAKTGAGRIKAHWPSTADLGFEWGWAWHNPTVYQGQTHKFKIRSALPMPAYVNQVKAAFMMMPSSFYDIPDVDMYLMDVCNPASPTIVLAETGYDLRGRFRLEAGNIAGRCLEIWLYGYRVPAAGIPVYAAEYYHTASSDNH